jgi:hypothetical protein
VTCKDTALEITPPLWLGDRSRPLVTARGYRMVHVWCTVGRLSEHCQAVVDELPVLVTGIWAVSVETGRYLRSSLSAVLIGSGSIRCSCGPRCALCASEPMVLQTGDRDATTCEIRRQRRFARAFSVGRHFVPLQAPPDSLLRPAPSLEGRAARPVRATVIPRR